MKAATVHEIKVELSTLKAAELVDLCLRLTKFKKENKELLTYLLFEGHDEQWGRDQAKDFVSHHYHQPSDEYHAEWDFGGNAKLARFGFVLGWLASSQTKSIEWTPGDEFEAARKTSEKQ